MHAVKKRQNKRATKNFVALKKNADVISFYLKKKPTIEETVSAHLSA